MHLAKHVGGWSTPQIGRVYNGRHHTTVLYAVQKMGRLREADESVAALVDELIEALTPGVTCTRPGPRDSIARIAKSLGTKEALAVRFKEARHRRREDAPGNLRTSRASRCSAFSV